MDQLKSKLNEYNLVMDDNYIEYLDALEYMVVDKAINVFDTSRKKVLFERYHGMGHRQLICIDPTKETDDKYFLVVIGGSNGYDCDYNFKNFTNLCVTTEPVFLNEKDLIKMVTITLHQIWFDPKNVDLMSDEALRMEMDDII